VHSAINIELTGVMFRMLSKYSKEKAKAVPDISVDQFEGNLNKTVHKL
jgi:hypothetical protein